VLTDGIIDSIPGSLIPEGKQESKDPWFCCGEARPEERGEETEREREREREARFGPLAGCPGPSFFSSFPFFFLL
jgi:hypothetical protein